MKKRIALLLMIGTLFVSPVSGDAELRLADARSYWLYEAGTRQVLAEYRSDMETPAASLTKLMTCLLTLEAIDRGALDWDETLTMPGDYVNPGGSTMQLVPGQRVTIRQLVNGLMIVSANDGAKVLASRIGGNEADFVKRMNERARELELKETTFLNANGLPEAAGQNMTSAEDMGKLSVYLLTVYGDKLLPITSRQALVVSSGKATLPATNTLMGMKKGVDGLKTGHTNAAGYCLAATAPFEARKDARLIAVVMGTTDESARDNAAKALIEWAEKRYTFMKVIDAGKAISAGNWKGLESRAVTGHPAHSMERFLMRDTKITTEVAIRLPGRLPLNKGDRIGTVRATLPGGEKLEVSLISDTEILRLTIKEKFKVFINVLLGWFAPKSVS